MQLTDRITVDPELCGGRPCVRGMRIRVVDVLDLFAAGLSTEQILAEMPDLEAEDLTACIQFAASALTILSWPHDSVGGRPTFPCDCPLDIG